MESMRGNNNEEQDKIKDQQEKRVTENQEEEEREEEEIQSMRIELSPALSILDWCLPERSFTDHGWLLDSEDEEEEAGVEDEQDEEEEEEMEDLLAGWIKDQSRLKEVEWDRKRKHAEVTTMTRTRTIGSPERKQQKTSQTVFRKRQALQEQKPSDWNQAKGRGV
ncbi:hypothetical protein EC973_002589 [Apophysomyces ossiformis]|uniref:Uncharacterized protein n=1 Tax=Apophysomyces ossiformis TaxID=679940 RepID=A0A8H7BMR9_9FUNG|nr:hypothetical protein EC973_002589 [Apophysomyces ossiformis]